MEVDHDYQNRCLGRVRNEYTRFLRGPQAEKRKTTGGNRGATSRDRLEMPRNGIEQGKTLTAGLGLIIFRTDR